MKNGKLQVAVIGCGGIANQKHLPALKSQSDKCEMVAFCDIRSRLRPLKQESMSSVRSPWQPQQKMLRR